MTVVLVRTIVIFAVLIVSMRLMGKRQVGQLQVSELVVTFMLSELAALPIADRAVPVSHALVPILALLSAEVILSFLETKSNKLKRILGGAPAALIRRGKLDAAALCRHRIELEELLSELRLAGVFDIADVQYAILEENGRISVKPKAGKAPASSSDAGIASEERGIARAVVVDGDVMKNAALSVGTDERAVADALAKLGVGIKNVFLLTADDTGAFTAYVRSGDGGVTAFSGKLGIKGGMR